MTTSRTYQVKEVARMSGVSVRALHHYDEIGLLVPSGRTESGYRLYDDDDLLRLQQILIGRELGMPLEEIKRSLEDPGFDRRAALERQREEITRRAERAAAMLRAIDTALAALTTEGDRIMKGDKANRTLRDMSGGEVSALFDGFDPSLHEDEVKRRWGKTDAYKESALRTGKYTKADWERYNGESHSIMTDAAQLFRSGAAADCDEAMEIAERHRLSIDRWFYTCGPKMHSGLAEMYEADVRFTENIEKYARGLTVWWVAAIRANAARLS